MRRIELRTSAWKAEAFTNRPHPQLAPSHRIQRHPTALQAVVRSSYTSSAKSWLRRRESNAPEQGYEPRQTPGLTAQRMVGADGYDPSRCSPSGRSRALIRRTRSPEPTPPGFGELERPAVIETALRDWQTRVLPLDDGRELVDGPRIELGRNAILQGSPAPQCPPPVKLKNEDRCSRAFTGLGLGASAEPAVCGAGR